MELEVYPTSPKKFFKSISANPTSSGIAVLDVVPQVKCVSDRKEPVVTKVDLPNNEVLDDDLSEVSPSEVLNRISHDLDYLLEGNQSPPMNNASPRHKSGSGSPSSSSSGIGKTAL